MSVAKKVDHCIYLSLGSNINPEINLLRALQILHHSVAVVANSTAWQSESVGYPGPDFLNAAVLIRTSLSTKNLKRQVLRKIEKALGRKRTANKYAPRPIDLDILIIDDKTVDHNIWTQAHLAAPLAELFPELRDHKKEGTLAQAANTLVSITKIKMRPDILRPRGV